MKIVGLMPVRNEDWCLGLTARAALKLVDHLIIFDHASTDRTPEIVREIMAEAEPNQVVYTRDEDPTWREMAHRQWMLDAARRLGATHIMMIDADQELARVVEAIKLLEASKFTMPGAAQSISFASAFSTWRVL